ncbi:hypothetical protein Mterra_02638 [Calidithermus terrae]|uniref:Uncharacterized protein n=1 Tax=Calidithermus terrae TaxID=1408545 RepID=A0A399EDR7_9DEIN|nr:DUF99 family protein [Calidithermus terrae]RIH82475.1 hypothetical protein Mterra_02638 [Calidithermus terrae]
MKPSKLSHAVGFDDFPFPREHRGDVSVVGAVYAGARLEGVLRGEIRRDGRNSTEVLARLVLRSKFNASLQLVFLQGIALAGFNVVDIHRLSETLERPVLVVTRRMPGLEAIREALLGKVPGGRRKWALIEKAGIPEPVAGVYVQRAGLSLEQAERALRRFALHSNIPEPLRTAHLIAGGIASGQSRARP